MKKIFALVLAVAMLSSMALAAAWVDGPAGTTRVDPNSTLTVSLANLENTKEYTRTIDKVLNTVTKGTKLNTLLVSGDFNASNFSISYKFTKGANLIKSIAINDEDELVEIKLIQDLSMFAPKYDNADPEKSKPANFVLDHITIKSKKALDNGLNKIVNKGSEFKVTGKKAWVGFDSTAIALSDGGDYVNGTLTKYDDSGDAYGVLNFNDSDVDYVNFSGRVYSGDKIYLKVNNTVDTDQKAALIAYPDADLRFVNITSNGLSANNDVQITAEKEEFVYELVDGKVVKSNLKWSEDDYAWVGKFRTNKNYVISDIELKAAAAADDVVVNPGTGANDVVGVAAALAIVSVVAAAAVSLKK